METLENNSLEWIVAEQVSKSTTENLTTSVSNLHPVIARLLIQRGYNSFDDVKALFNPMCDDISAFGTMKGEDRAAVRLKKAIDTGQKILVYGDYDVDGTCSVSMLYLFLKYAGADVEYYIPDRYKEGYGVSKAGIDFAKEHSIDLLITVDCGINASRELGRATQAGIDVVICDHHLPALELPEVFAILNPKQKDCPFTGKELCGAGVGLMLIRSTARLMGKPDAWLEYLDLTAIATCCDIVPLMGINRIIVSAGLQKLNNETRRLGIEALLNTAKFHEKLTVSDIVFKIGPRINAAGRLKHAGLAVKTLVETGPEKAKALAAEIDQLNGKRKTLDKQFTAEAIQQMTDADPGLKLASTVVHHPGWHKGVIGIVASRLIEQRYRPTIVFAENDGMFTGSARSVNGFNLYNALDQCREHLERFGGHAAAAGLSLKTEKLPDFTQAFEQAVQSTISAESKAPRLKIDLEVNLGDWYNDKTQRFISQLNRLRPFGPMNLAPVFSTGKCRASFPQIVGSDHLRFQVAQTGDDPRRKLNVIAFGMANYYGALTENKEFELAYTIEEKTWKGNTSIQLNAKDIRVAS